jgi:outer membrane protein
MTEMMKQNHFNSEWEQIFKITLDKEINKMTKNFLVILFSSFLLLPISVSAETEIFKIGYVVVEKILKQAPQTAASNKKLEKEFKSRTDGLQKKVKSIQKQEKDFNKNNVTMTATERQKAQKKIQNSKIEIQRIERELREDIDIRRREEIGKLQQKINEAIEDLAEKEKYDLILYQGVAFASKEIDITDKLIKVLGKTK